MDFARFDNRGYPTLDVRTGYARWAPTYDDTVPDSLDIGLLQRLSTPAWRRHDRAVDLACGTGRTAAWLRERGVGAIDGVDVTPEMLGAATERAEHDQLVEADVTATGLSSGTYDLAVASLFDEHLADLYPFYREAHRITTTDASFVLVGLHPHFLMIAGMPTHFTDASGNSLAITTYVHLVSDHVRAARAAGWHLAEFEEGIIDAEWLAVKPKWERFRGHPVSAAYVWQR